jgi:hypothetical protein
VKIDDFLKAAEELKEILAPVEEEDAFLFETSLTPSSTEVLYSWHPKRLYKLRKAASEAATEWVEVPSVTTVLNVLDKSGAISWWSMVQGVNGVLELLDRGVLNTSDVITGKLFDASYGEVEAADIVKFLTEQKLTVNHVKDVAANRGVNVHSALEAWAVDQSFRADPELYQEHEKGYVVGLNKFLDDLGAVEDVQAEVMVGSVKHGFAGRYDLRLWIDSTEMVTRIYPKRDNKVEYIPGGNYLLDLKTSKGCYPTHSLQLAAYELASIECGYGPTDYRAVIHVTADGEYEFRRTTATGDQFLSILQCHNTMQSGKWFL